MVLSPKNIKINSAKINSAKINEDKIHENGLFIFRHDLRIVDNTGLNLLNTKCKNIYTVFIFTPEQVTNTFNSKSENAIQFMIECLEVLSDDIKKNGGNLYSFYGENDKIIEYLIKQLDITIIGFNKDAYDINRDEKIINLCEKINVNVINADDYYETSIQQHIGLQPQTSWRFQIR